MRPLDAYGVGNDTLNGGAGVDTLIGGLGDDTYVVDSADDLIIEFADEGNDQVLSQAVDYALSEHLESLTLTMSSAAVTGTGNASANVIIGNEKNNTLSGLAGDDTLDGGSGDDTLIGGTGDDTLVGGLGSDVYIFNEGDGQDTIIGNNLTRDELQIKTNHNNLQFTRNGLDLIVTLSHTQDAM